jgi:AcrR family transcriptional regulator
MGLREKKKIEIRREISRIGIELFLKNGFEATTVDDIVGPLGIAKRTFFRYFDSKEDVVFAWYEELTSELVSTLKSRPAEETPLKAVCETMLSLLQYYDSDIKWAKSMVRLSSETPNLIGKSFQKKAIWVNELSLVLSKRLKGTKSSELKARVVVGCVMAAFTAAIDEWYGKGGNKELRPILQAAFLTLRSL